MKAPSRVRRRTAATIGFLILLGGLLPSGAALSAPDRIEPAELPRGSDPAIAHLVHDTIRDGDLRVRATTRGRHDALWVVDGGYLLRDYNVGPRRLTRVTYVSSASDRRTVARSRQWIDVEVSVSGDRLAVQTWPGSLTQHSVITVSRPATGRVLAQRDLRLASLVAVTDARVLVGLRSHWRHPVTQWWNYRTGTVRRLHDEAAQRADVRHDKVVFATPGRGEFCTRVAVLSRPRHTLWRSCRMLPHQWSPSGRRALGTRAYFDAAGTDRWWVVRGRAGSRVAGIAGRLDWHAVWEDETHFLTFAQGDAGGAAVIRCDLTGACERASRVWDVPLPSEPSLYYAPPPVVLAENVLEAVAPTLRAARILGTPGDDDLFGTASRDRILGLAGADAVESYAGADVVHGGAGDDLVRLGPNPLQTGPAGDLGFGGPGDDLVAGGPGFDVLVGNRGADTLLGGRGTGNFEDREGPDVVRGGPAGDVVYLGRGADRVNAGAHGDAVFVGDDGRRDVIRCGPGRDHVYHGDAIDPRDRFLGCEEFAAGP